MHGVRVSSLRWTVAAYCAALGALMLVTSHQFRLPAYAWLQPRLALWGALLLLAGLVLLAITVLKPFGWLVIVSHATVAALLALLANGFATAGDWLGFINHSLLALGVVVAGMSGTLLPPAARPPHTSVVMDDPPEGQQPGAIQIDLLALVIGLSAALGGLLMLVYPQSLDISLYHPVMQYLLPWYGAAFLVGGIGLLLTQCERVVPEQPRPAAGAVYLFCSVVFFSAFTLAAFPRSSLPTMVLFGGYGAAVAFLPWVGSHFQGFVSASLRTRLALTLGAATMVPIVAVVALLGAEAERAVKRDVLARQEGSAEVLAEAISDHIRLHGAALNSLARVPGLAEMAPADQIEYLKVFARSYPGVLSFTLYSADGSLVGGSDGASDAQSVAGSMLFQEARRTGRLSMDVTISPAFMRPVFTLGVPVYDVRGAFAGIVTSSVESNRVVDLLSNAGADTSRAIHLLDSSARLLVDSHSDNIDIQDLLAGPPYTTILAATEDQGFLTYSVGDDERLVGYARVPDLNWIVVIERSTATAMEGMWAGHDLAFLALLGFLVLTTLSGIVLANRLTAPLSRLAYAARELASGNTYAPLPSSRITEIEHLATVFKEMRQTIATRTLERQRAQDALRKANLDLEAKVADRTAELSALNQKLHQELVERRRAEQERECLLAENRRQREFLERLVESSPTAIAVVRGPEHRYELLNPAYRRTVIDGADEPIAGFRFSDIEPSGEVGLEHLDAVYHSGEPLSLRELLLPARGGHENAYLDLALVPLKSDADHVDGVLLLANDVSQMVRARKQIEELAEQLADERRFLSTIMDHVPAAISYLDENLIYRQCNPAAAEQLGLPVEQILGHQLYEVVPGNPELWHAVESVLETGKPYPAPVMSIHWRDRPDEGEHHYMVAYLPDRDETGHVRGVFAQGQEITEMVLMEEALRQARDELEQRVEERTGELRTANQALQQSRQQLQMLSRRLVELQENERRVIARELHDEAGSSLTSLKLGLGFLERDIDNRQAVLGQIQSLRNLTDSVLDGLHRLAMNLRPASLDRLGLVPALRQYVDEFGRQHGMKAQFVSFGFDDRRLLPEIEITLYRVVQEALTNVARHAKAGNVGVVLERHPDRLVAIIEDDGVGFDSVDATNGGRLGLFGMRERAEMMDGKLTIESAPGSGTTIFVEIPTSEALPADTPVEQVGVSGAA